MHTTDGRLRSDFTYRTTTARIEFGEGSSERVGEALDGIGASRALVLSTAHQVDQAEGVARRLGAQCAGTFTNATMHTPTAITERAMESYRRSGADCVVAIGGGSTIGLGKAIALRTACPQVAIPTTYAGSEVTPILGQTEDGTKITLSDPKVLPDVVLYDPALTTGLPLGMSLTSGFNALAHALEGLYAQNRNPISSLMADEGAGAILEALPMLKADPGDTEGRRLALYGAWLCGTVLGNVGMALHHKLCHVLGGMFDLPHAETHAVVLPHAMAFNAPRAATELARVKARLNVDEVGRGLFDLGRTLGMPSSLKALGMPEAGIAKAARQAVQNPYWNPRPFTADDMTALITDAYHGNPPSSHG